ncbi:MAG: Virginiamycin B lyase, partial [Candidatus Eremiobacteraeota bacterium]|nr:Virginiamycin B lyase [Candidatus Eremiobacteraeota bacterium]
VTLFAVPTPNSEPFDIVKGPNRTLWFSERSAGKIGVLSY